MENKKENIEIKVNTNNISEKKLIRTGDWLNDLNTLIQCVCYIRRRSQSDVK